MPHDAGRGARTVLLAHNYYQHAGGEDQVFSAEASLLESRGHTVFRHVDHNDRVADMTALTAGAATLWNQRAKSRLDLLLEADRPDVIHFHNTFPLISPAAYYAARRWGVPVVQTLHNYRLICPGATLFRNGEICEDCLTPPSFAPALRHGCYRGSRAATAATVAMLTIHRALGTWRSLVDIYVALTEFARRKYIEGGLPADRICVKPNFMVSDPGCGTGDGQFVLFVGRLTSEKGIQVMLDAWRDLPGIPLRLVGDGPLRDVAWPKGVSWLGHQPREQVLTLMKTASVLVFPSIWYECAPNTIVEAMACGLPVIASDIGALPELVLNGRTGLLFRPGDASDLADKVRSVFGNPDGLQRMRTAARREFQDKYTSERNYEMLMAIYGQAIENANARRRAAS